MKRPYQQRARIGSALWVSTDEECFLFRVTRFRGFKLLACADRATAGPAWPTRLYWGRAFKVKRPTKVDNPTGSEPPYAAMGESAKRFPNLADFLTKRTYEDGSVRKPGVLICFAHNQTFSWIVKEPSAGLLIRGECSSWDKLNSTIESVLSMSTVPWEEDPRAEQPKRRK